MTWTKEEYEKLQWELMLSKAKGLQFAECDACRAKPGSPILCRGCLHNRHIIELLSQPEKREWCESCYRIALGVGLSCRKHPERGR